MVNQGRAGQALFFFSDFFLDFFCRFWYFFEKIFNILTILLHDLSWFVVILTRYWILNVFTIIFNLFKENFSFLQILFFSLSIFFLLYFFFYFCIYFNYFKILFEIFTFTFFLNRQKKDDSNFEMFSCQLLFCTHGILWPNSTWCVCLWYGGKVSTRYILLLLVSLRYSLREKDSRCVLRYVKVFTTRRRSDFLSVFSYFWIFNFFKCDLYF